MKKVMMIAAIAAALVSCQSKGTQNNDSTVDEGVLTVAGNDYDLSGCGRSRKK